MDKIITVLPKDLMNIVLEYSHHKKNKYDEGVEEINICIRIFKISWNYPREGYTPSIPRHYKVFTKNQVILIVVVVIYLGIGIVVKVFLNHIFFIVQKNHIVYVKI